MYAIVNISDQQFRVEPDSSVIVPLLKAEPGEAITFDEVLLYNDGSETRIGKPMVEGCSVTAEIVKHGLGKKVSVFKKKRRQGYRRNKGHRQAFTEIVIKGIRG